MFLRIGVPFWVDWRLARKEATPNDVLKGIPQLISATPNLAEVNIGALNGLLPSRANVRSGALKPGPTWNMVF